MWIFTNTAFVSAVAHRDKPGYMMVRARAAGDLEQFFGPKVESFKTENADYRYRCVVPCEVFEAAVLQAAISVDYPNFKGSLRPQDHRRYTAYMGVWQAMLGLQEVRAPGRGYYDAPDGSGDYTGPVDSGLFGNPAQIEIDAEAMNGPQDPVVYWCPACGSDITAEVDINTGECPYCGKEF